MFIKDATTRASIYGICAAGGGLALIYGLVNAVQLGGWLALAGAVIGVTNGLALANTKTGKHEA